MTVFTRFRANGSDYTDYTNLDVTKSISEHGTASTFSASFDSPYGRHKTDFNVGDEVKINAGQGVIFNQLGQWLMDEGSGTRINDDAGSIVGSIVGTPSWTQGKIRSGLAFPGTSGNYIELGSPVILQPTGSISISLWFNPTANAVLNTLVVNKNPSGTGAGSMQGYWMAYDRRTAESLYWNLGFNTTQALINNAVVLNIGSWNHLVSTYDGTKMFNYSNGSFIGSSVTLGSLINYSGTQTLKFGNIQIANQHFLSGILDDVRVYNRALSLTEVRDLYRNGSATYDFNLFTGIIEDASFNGEGLEQKLELRGRDYTSRLIDNNIQPVVYTNIEVGSIVRDILLDNMSGLSYNYVKTTPVTLKRIAFNQTPIYDALIELGDLSNHIFYVDSYKNVHFEPLGSVASNLTFGSGNVIRMTYDKTREGMANKIWVYGDRYLAGFREKISTGSPAGGSVYTLISKPHNTQVDYLGSLRKGGVFEMTVANTSGPDYLVNFHDRQLVFLSGTSIGYSSIPVSGGSILVTYDRDLPIVKYGENQTSIQNFGPKTKIIVDKSIKDPNTAVDILNSELLNTDPFNNIDLELKGWQIFSPGQIATVTMGDFNLDDSFTIIDADYKFNPESVQQENVTHVKMDKKELDLTDKIRDMKKRLEALEASDLQSTDVYTRLQLGLGSMLVVGSYWEVRTRYFTGSEFRLWGEGASPPGVSGGGIVVGLLSSGTGLGAGSNSYLASGTIAGLTTFGVIQSGGYV